MAPISEQRPTSSPLAQQNHSRTSSFFSFRKGSNDGPQRSLSLLGKSQSNGAGAAHTLAPQFQSQNRNSLVRTPSQTQSPPVQELSRITSAPTQQQQQPPAQPQPLHPEIRSVVQLTVAHAHKIYYSGPLVRRIERQPDGQRPAKDEGWTDVWAQLGGTTLSIWDMKMVQEASQQGKEVPPTYVNMTDAVSLIPLF
jgi:CCR4-NOT transcriptional complex subunit CAF120